MRHLVLISAALIAASQEPARVPDPKDSKLINWRAYDTETGEMFLVFNGYGQFDQNKGTGSLTRLWLKYFTKATAERPASEINVFANRCDLTGLEREEGSKNMVFRFSQGLRVLVDDNVRLWTTEGTLEAESKILKCPGTTHLVKFTWPLEIDLASALVFMEPVELGWLRLFGAPEPDYELVGDDFMFDAVSHSFTAMRNGRIRMKGSPGDLIEGGPAKPRPKTDQPTELRCEGPLRLRNLPPPGADAWPTLHVTAEKNVVIEHRAKDSVTRSHSDSASFYIATPPKKSKDKPRPLSAVLSGQVRIESTGGFTAAGDQVEWSHQDDLMRLTGVPGVQIVQGDQKLRAREVIVDRLNRAIDFKGDIEATFLSSEDAKDLTTLTPGDLRLTTDARGRPVGIHASNGVRLSGALDARGTSFEWDLDTGEGTLRGVPFARIQEGFNLVLAPLVSFRGATIDKALMTVKGPKLMRFFGELDPPRNIGIDLADAALGLPGLARRPAEPALNSSAATLEAALGLPGLQKIPERRNSVMDFTITCDGDVVVDQQAGVVKLVDRCQVRSQDSTLNSDRLFVFLKATARNPDRKTSIDRVLGSGRVVAVYSEGPTGGRLRVDGETFELKLDPTLGPKGERVVTIVGHPTGRLQFGGQESQFERMIFNLDNKTFGMTRGSLPFNF